MIDYTKELREQLQQIDRLLEKAEKRLKKNKDVDARALRVSKRQNGYQYYLEDETGKRCYIKSRDVEIVRKVAQKHYDEQIYYKILQQRNKLSRFLRSYDVLQIESAYTKMCEARKELVEPILETTENVIAQWEKENRGGMNPFPMAGQYLTNKGEYVRSKSEKILADIFHKYGIPYVYEPMFEHSNGSYVYPDFALLNVRKQKTIYWEHFGLITDGDYASKAMQKLIDYETSGLRLGEDLLISMESERTPLNLREIDDKIRQYILEV